MASGGPREGGRIERGEEGDEEEEEKEAGLVVSYGEFE